MLLQTVRDTCEWQFISALFLGVGERKDPPPLLSFDQINVIPSKKKQVWGGVSVEVEI